MQSKCSQKTGRNTRRVDQRVVKYFVYIQPIKLYKLHLANKNILVPVTSHPGNPSPHEEIVSTGYRSEKCTNVIFSGIKELIIFLLLK